MTHRLLRRARALLHRHRTQARRLLRSLRLDFGDFEVRLGDDDGLDAI